MTKHIVTLVVELEQAEIEELLANAPDREGLLAIYPFDIRKDFANYGQPQCPGLLDLEAGKPD